jgi:hypothetical protein
VPAHKLLEGNAEEKQTEAALAQLRGLTPFEL